MEAMILSGGRGTRLRPITDSIPKPLIPINSTPLIDWSIKYLKKFGITDIILCNGYRSKQIERYLKSKIILVVQYNTRLKKHHWVRQVQLKKP